MLSASAFNAFLKTLEEPPSYAKFILATTEKHKIIPTILSRCQIFDFKRIQVPDIFKHLQNVSEQEHIEAEEAGLQIIARKADGALRDALSIFDQIVSFAGKKITYQDVIDNLNILDMEYYFNLVDDFLANNTQSVLNRFNEILQSGFDGQHLINGLGEHLRNLLISKDEATNSLLEVGDTFKPRYKEQADKVDAIYLMQALDLVNECDVQYRNSNNKRLHVELTLLRLASLNQKPDDVKKKAF
jgi:DNA polymerase-3 subunit gamma/tau